MARPDRDPVVRQALERAATSGIGAWMCQHDEAEGSWSNTTSHLFGIESGSDRSALFERVHPDDRAALESHLAALGKGSHESIEFRVVIPGRGVRHVRAEVIEDVLLGGARALVGTLEDITDMRWLERELAVHLATSRALAEWIGEASATWTLRAMAESMDFDYAAFWVPRGNSLSPHALWRTAALESGFINAVRSVSLADDTGLPSQALRHRVPVVVHLAEFPPTLRVPATGADIRLGVAVPAVTRGEVRAVVEFYAREETPDPDRLGRTLSGIGHELGEFFARRSAHLAPPVLTPRELEVLALGAEGLAVPEIAAQLTLSPATVKTHFTHIYAKLQVTDRAAAVASGLRLGLLE